MYRTCFSEHQFILSESIKEENLVVPESQALPEIPATDYLSQDLKC